jgi:hypothetical protein
LNRILCSLLACLQQHLYSSSYTAAVQPQQFSSQLTDSICHVFSHNHPDRTGSAKRLANGRMPRISFADMILSSDDTGKPIFTFLFFKMLEKWRCN